jgi:hypothetical protein
LWIRSLPNGKPERLAAVQLWHRRGSLRRASGSPISKMTFLM